MPPLLRSVLAWLSAAAITSAAGMSAGPASTREPVTVFAAASLTDAIERIADLHEQETGRPIRLSLASSSTLARQIEAGAPADIFLSANEQWMDYLVAAGLIEADSRVSRIGNSLVLIAPNDSPIGEAAVTAELDLNALMAPGERIAVGDPDHVPAGLYAREALEVLGLWDEAEKRLARAADVRAALALVATGEAPLGIVYATDAAASPQVKVLGHFPDGSHTDITYPFAIVAGEADREVDATFEFLLGVEAIDVFRDAGFAVR